MELLWQFACGFISFVPSFDSTPESAEKSITIDFRRQERQLEFKGRTRRRQRQRGTSREAWDPRHNMHVPAQLKVTNMNLSEATDYKVSTPHSYWGLTFKWVFWYFQTRVHLYVTTSQFGTTCETWLKSSKISEGGLLSKAGLVFYKDFILDKKVSLCLLGIALRCNCSLCVAQFWCLFWQFMVWSGREFSPGVSKSTLMLDGA